MRHAFDIALKDLRVYLRDPSALGILLAMPAVLIVILGFALGGVMSGGGDSQIAVAIVNLDSHGAASASDDGSAAKLVDGLTGAAGLKTLFTMERNRDLGSVRARVASGQLAAALVIPKGFDADLGAGRSVQLEVLKDPGSATAAGIWESVVKSASTKYSAVSIIVRTVTEAAQNTNSPALSKPGGASSLYGYALSKALPDDALDGVRVSDEVAGSTVKISSLDYYSLAMTAMFLMFGAMFGAFSVIRERSEQTMARILASPAPRSAVIGGKMLGIFVLGTFQFAVLYVFTRFVLRVQWGSSVAATILVALAEIAAVTGLGMLIASLAHSARAVGGIGPLTIQIQALLGGSFFPIAILPLWLQPIRYVSVVGWAMEGWRRVQVQGEGVVGVLGPVAALFAFAAVFYAFSVWRTRAGAA